jgi:gamma-glutamyltranspeptidase/glutathione hydrolase
LWTAADPECEPAGESTTQVSVADQFGNVVALTQTLSRSFGAKVATPNLGFCYNSLLEAFNVEKPHCPGYLRPRSVCASHMAPTMVLRDGHVMIALGTPGSARIASITALVVSNMVDRGMDLRDAVAAPRITWGGTDRQRVSIEILDPFTRSDAEALAAMGYEGMTVLTFPPPDNDEAVSFGGVNAVGFDPQDHRWIGVVDPRRGGLAMGPRAIAAAE